MENYKKELEQALIERFKQDAIISAIEKKIEEFAKNIVLRKYDGIKIKRGKFDYKLFNVQANCYNKDSSFYTDTVRLSLTYITTSALSAPQKKALSISKDLYKKNGYMGRIDEKYGVLIIEETYAPTIENVVKGIINLDIKDKVTD